jgi:hypothetical protein
LKAGGKHFSQNADYRGKRKGGESYPLNKMSAV